MLRRPSPIVTLLAILTASVLATGCAGGSDLEDTTPDLEQLWGAPLQPAGDDGDDDTTVTLAELEGGAAALLFWSPADGLCRGCRDQLASLEAAAAAHPDVVIAPVAGRTGDRALSDFLATVPAPVRNCTGCTLDAVTLDDRGGEAWGAVPVIAPPTWLFVSADGSTRVVRSTLSAGQLDDRLAGLAAG